RALSRSHSCHASSRPRTICSGRWCTPWHRARRSSRSDVSDRLPTAVELAGIPSMNGLTAEEAQFVYNCEVLGLPVRKAASMAGMPPTMVAKPHLQQARELLKRELRGAVNITKDDVVFGMREAIARARI